MTEDPFKEILKILAKDRRYDLCSVLLTLLDEIEEEEDTDFLPLEDGEPEPIEEYFTGNSIPEEYDEDDIGMTADGFLYLKD